MAKSYKDDVAGTKEFYDVVTPVCSFNIFLINILQSVFILNFFDKKTNCKEYLLFYNFEYVSKKNTFCCITLVLYKNISVY